MEIHIRGPRVGRIMIDMVLAFGLLLGAMFTSGWTQVICGVVLLADITWNLYCLDRTNAMAIGIFRAMTGAPCEDCGETHGE